MIYTSSDLYDFRKRNAIIDRSYRRLERSDFENTQEWLTHCVCELAAEIERMKQHGTEATHNADAPVP
jgi:hypothetical protein